MRVNRWGSVGPGHKTEEKLPIYPTNCTVCNHHNPYTGKEHMVSIGNTAPIVDVYVCRTCRPKWDREQEVAKLKAEAAECEAAKEALLYGR